MKGIIILILKALWHNRLRSALVRLNNIAKLPKFNQIGKGTLINHPFYYGNTDCINIGSDCHIGRNCDFGVIKSSGNSGLISIGNRVRITSNCQIYSGKSVEIEDDVLIASNVFICDCTHGYSKIDTPYQYQGYTPCKEIKIGAGAWIGQNVMLMPGVTIGRCSIIGANSVVNNSIPDFCIAVGTPAKIIKKWDFDFNGWVSFKS